jgi:hypothetical protein
MAGAPFDIRQRSVAGCFFCLTCLSLHTLALSHGHGHDQVPNSRKDDGMKKVSKDQWVAMFREIGLDEGAMKRWHQLFEQRHPDGHQDFLQWLGLTPQEIERIRAASR